MDGDKRYVYGVIEVDENDLDLAVDGVAGAEQVYAIKDRRHAAVVSDVDSLEPPESEENLRAHDTVLRTVMEESGRTVVPMRYGMVFDSEQALTHVLRRGRRAFQASLDELEGKIEVGVKVIADEDADVDPDSVRAVVEAELDPLSEAVSTGNRFIDRLVLNRSYLVNRTDREAFDDAVGRVRGKLDGVTVQYSGPWAPYSFVDIEVGVAP